MLIVLIHWRIKPTDEDETAFLRFRSGKPPGGMAAVAGEFLSAPIAANKLPYQPDDLFFGHGVLDCRHFINVGL